MEKPKHARMKLQCRIQAERNQNQVEICRRENIQPQLFSRWKIKFKEAGVEGFKNLKRGRKSKSDPKMMYFEQELARVKSAFVDQSVELLILKKSAWWRLQKSIRA